jgi:hypothetical protein
MAINRLQDPGDALRYIVEYVQLPLDTVPVAKLVAIEHQLEAFISRESPARELVGTTLGRVGLHLLQREGRAVLEGVAQGGTFTMAGDLVLSFYAIRRDGELSIQVLGSHLDRMLYQIIRVIERVGVDRLLRCQAPDCKRLFLKVTRKEFCSTKCQMRMYMRGKRADEKEEREREQANAKTKRTRRR